MCARIVKSSSNLWQCGQDWRELTFNHFLIADHRALFDAVVKTT
jgi:hypothetical protein